MLFLTPAIAAGFLFLVMWRGGVLPRPSIVGAWYLAGVTLQFFLGSRSTLIWLAGLLINVAVGVYLSVRLKMS